MLAERNLKHYIGKRLRRLEWEVAYWGKGAKGERESLQEILLTDRLFRAIENINSVTLNEDERKDLVSKILLIPNTIEGIKSFLDYAKNGITLRLRKNNEEREKQIYLWDFEHSENNDFFAVEEFEIEENERRRRFDFCLIINGIPLVGIETKNPFSEEDRGTTWYDAYKQILEYEGTIPSVFKYIQFCVASDGYNTKHFPNFYASDYSSYIEKQKGIWKSFYPFKEEDVKPLKLFPHLDSTIFGMLSRKNLLDLIENFVFVKRFKDSYSKIIGWYTQFEASNLIVKRVTEEKEKKLGLIWHWQGSGKTLTMAFASWKLQRNRQLKAPTIFIIVDRRDLQKQIVEEEFAPIGIEIENVDSIKELSNVLRWGGKEREGKRGIFISLIQKFVPEKLKRLHDAGEINLERENIIVFTDESHRSQYGILANVVRGIFKNASVFGFTGTPLTKPERNTFAKFSPTGELYLHRFGMLESVDNGFTIPIRYEARLLELHLKEEEIRQLAQYEEEVIEELTPGEVKLWRRKVKPKLALLKSPGRISRISRDIAEYFKAKVEKTQLKVMVATVDRESCVLFKRELDKQGFDPRLTEIVMTYQGREKSKIIADYKEKLEKRFGHSDFDKINDDIRDKFRRESSPKILIVSDMLLTGFDARNLWVLFLHKPLKEHRLLQAIARTNRPLQESKEFGLVVDYIGVSDRLDQAIQQFETDFQNEAKLVIRPIASSEADFQKLADELRNMLAGVEIRAVEDVDNAVEVLVRDGREKDFEDKSRRLRTLFELLSPSDVIYKNLELYKWIICVAVSLNRHRNIGMRLDEIEKMSHKTYELIQQTVGIGEIEKVGEVEITKEMAKLEITHKPAAAIRVLGGIRERTRGRRSDFYASVAVEIEQIVGQMRHQKAITKEVIDRIKAVQNRVEEREQERSKLGNVFPVLDAMRHYFTDSDKVRSASAEIVKGLEKRDLLEKEGFLKGALRKEIRRTIREQIVRSFGVSDKTDEIVEKIFTNLEEEYV